MQQPSSEHEACHTERGPLARVRPPLGDPNNAAHVTARI